MAPRPPAVIIPGDVPASLGIARALGRRGIPIYTLDADPHAIGMASKYTTPVPVAGDGGEVDPRLDALLALGRKLETPAVLFPVNDDAVILCSQARQALQAYYHFVMPEHATVVDLVSKDGLYRISNAAGIPSPGTFEPRDADDLAAIAARVQYPVILKPIFSLSWHRPEIIEMLRTHPLSGPPKVAFCRDREALLQTYQAIAAYDARMVVQEVIEGPDENLVYFCFYLNRDSQPLATFAGRKMRVLPVGFGSACYVRSIYDAGLEAVSLKLLDAVHYQGLGGVEFKGDSRDGRYKIIEFNARFGLWDALGVRCGVDIPYIAYCDTLGLPVEPQRSYRTGVAWFDFQRDARSFLIYRQQGRLSLVDWLRSFRGEKQWAVYSPDDLGPSLAGYQEMARRPLSGIRRRFAALAGRVKRPNTAR